MRLKDKVALVTGGASGVGQATAKRFVAEGARVVLTDLNREAGAALAAELGANAHFIVQDVANEDDWARVIDGAQARFGALDVLVNNAGILVPGDVETMTLADWHKVMRVNADSVFLGTRAGVLAMKERGGSIVNIASSSSWLPVQGYAGYSASKAAVGALTRAAALHCRKSGYTVRVNSVHPDGIWTPMTAASAPGVDPKYLLFDAKKNPKGRACLPEDVVAMVLFLASDEARAVNGAAMNVDNAILGA